MEVLEKNHIQDFRSHIHRNKSLTKEIEELREHNERLQLKLKVNIDHKPCSQALYIIIS